MLVCVVATIGYAGLAAAAVWSELVHAIIPWWPLFAAASLLGWISLDVWSPRQAGPARQVAALVAFVGLQVLATSPLVAMGLELGGPRVIAGAGIVTLAVFAALTVFALAKPTTYLEPIDPLVVLAILVGVTVIVALGLHLPARFAWGAAAIGLTGIFVLREISNTFAYVGPGEHVAGGTHLFACISVLFAELVYYFTALVLTL